MSNLRRKRFKELTTYTYDYEGTLVKSVDKIQDINVIKINSKLNAKMQIKKNKFKNQQANNVLTVKLNKLDRFHHSSGDHGGLIKPF